MCFSVFSLYNKHPKDRVFFCTGFQPELILMQECHLQEHKRVSSLPACFIVTKASEPPLRRLYAARSSAFPLVSCARRRCLRLSQRVLEAAQSAVRLWCFWFCPRCCCLAVYCARQPSAVLQQAGWSGSCAPSAALQAVACPPLGSRQILPPSN